MLSMKIFPSPLFVSSLALVLFLHPTELSAQTWEQVISTDGSKPVARHEAAFVNLGHKSYLLGGRGIRTVSIYDHKSGTWSQGSKPPLELHHFQPVVYKKKIYIIGALTGGYPAETPVEHVMIYHPKKDQWIEGDPIPSERQRGSTGNVLYKGKIYITCGIKNGHIGDHKNWLDIYDPKSGQWEILPDAPRARDHFQAAVADDRLYVLGGRKSMAPDAVFAHPVSEIDYFDFKTGRWHSVKDPLPTLRAGNFVFNQEREIWVIGGESADQEKAHNEVEALHVDTHTWRELPALLEGRHGTGAIRYRGSLYIASGCGNRGGSPELESMEKMVIDRQQ